MTRPESLPFTESDDANRLLATDGFALLLGMLFDQQFPMERAFYGPQLLKERLGGQLTPGLVADTDLEDLEAVFRGPPAIHRYPASMAKRAQDLAHVVIDDYGGDAESLWDEAEDGSELLRRLRALPGFGAEKSRIFVGLLGKRLGVRPRGWEEKAADWPSIADVADYADVLVLREKKKAMKAAKKG
jgi:uncharacterized HhH-GPD family protein